MHSTHDALGSGALEPGTLTADDTRHLAACIELAKEAKARGDHPIGSRLVSASGAVLHEDSNRAVTTNDPLAHPEYALTRWAMEQLSAEEREGATLYTSLEHCPFCFGAAFYARLGRLVFAVSGAQLRPVRGEHVPALAVSAHELASAAVGGTIRVAGPDPSLAEPGLAVHHGHW